MKSFTKNYFRKNPICPFGELPWKKYYWSYQRKIPHYEDSYWGSASDPDGKVRNILNEWGQQVKNVGHIRDFLNKISPKISKKILDIGCGPGFLLSSLDSGWDKYGMDVSATALKVCSKFAKVFKGTLARAKFKNLTFDVIVMNHVVEHLLRPLSYIKEIHRILKNKGIFIIETPDFDSMCARRFGKKYRMLHDPGHVSLFTTASLIKMLEDYGFEIIQIEYPFFDTMYFTRENVDKIFDVTKVSPPFYGNHVTIYSMKK